MISHAKINRIECNVGIVAKQHYTSSWKLRREEVSQPKLLISCPCILRMVIIAKGIETVHCNDAGTTDQPLHNTYNCC